MIRGAIIFCLVNYCALLFSQPPALSRNFPASRKSVPLHILNNNPRFFYLLRYNKAIHDLVVERRAKPTAEILGITPLRMDSVNAGWFDYERLDYLFFEDHNKVFYVFEKVLNDKQSLYLRVIDSTGKASGFILLAEQIKDHATRETSLEFKITPSKKLLIVQSQFSYSGLVKKQAILYDAPKRTKLWTKQLPGISEETTFSSGFTCDSRNDLYYFQARLHFLEFRRAYRSQVQLQVPVFACDGVTVTRIDSKDSVCHYPLQIPLLYKLQDVSLIPADSAALCIVHYSSADEDGKEKVHLYSSRITDQSTNADPLDLSPLAEHLDKSLTYYDGTDFNAAADKSFRMSGAVAAGDSMSYVFSEREEDHFYKEVLCFEINTISGKISSQVIIPRKIYFLKEQTLFRNLEFVHHQFSQGKLYSFVLENRSNQKKDPGAFKYHSFNKQSYLKNGSLVSYVQVPGHIMQKEVIFMNGDLDFIPLRYDGTQPDFIFYLSKPRIERFATVSLCQPL